MPAGKRNRKIIIERATMGENAFGEEVPSWETYAQPFAEVLFGSGQERREAATEVGGATATFRVLHTGLTEAVTVEDRISFDGSTWAIHSNIPSLKLNRHREITASRRTDA